MDFTKQIFTATAFMMALNTTSVAEEFSWPDKYIALGAEGALTVISNDSREFDGDTFDSYFEGGLALHHRLNKEFSARMQYSDGSSKMDQSDADIDIDRFALGARRHLEAFNSTPWYPFFGAGYNYISYEGAGIDTHEDSIFAEVGIQRLLSERVIFEAGVRAIYENKDSLLDGQPFIGLQFLFSDEQSETPDVVVAAPLDTDQDGVIDPMDKCPNTEPDVKVNESGCPEMLTRTIQTSLYVDFETNKSIVKQSSYPEIKEFADLLKQYVNSELVLEGYTDSVGSFSYNMKLSEARAAAVKNVLVEEYGIAIDRIESVGRGETRPIANNATAEGRAKNRRVEATLKASYTEIIRK